MGDDLQITLTSRDGVLASARMDVTARRVTSLSLEEGATERVFKGLCVLSGCVEAILETERRRTREERA